MDFSNICAQLEKNISKRFLSRYTALFIPLRRVRSFSARFNRPKRHRAVCKTFLKVFQQRAFLMKILSHY